MKVTKTTIRSNEDDLNEDELKEIIAGAAPEASGKSIADLEAALERLLDEFARGIARLVPSSPADETGMRKTPGHERG